MKQANYFFVFMNLAVQICMNGQVAKVKHLMLLSNKQLPLLKLHEEIQNKILTDKQINYKLAYCKVNCISNVVKLRLILILF